MQAIIAIVATFGLIGFSLFLGGQAAAFWSTQSAILVILGTVGIVVIGVRPDEWRSIARSLPRLFNDSTPNCRTAIIQFTDLATRMRKTGIKAIQEAKLSFSNPYLIQGAELVADGVSSQVVEQILMSTAETEVRSRMRLANLLRRASDIAPAMGLIGTLIGLVQMLGTLSNPDTLGPAMAIALLTTLYGTILGHVVCAPLAIRIESQLEAEFAWYRVCAHGFAALCRSEHPIHMESQLYAMSPGLHMARR